MTGIDHRRPRGVFGTWGCLPISITQNRKKPKMYGLKLIVFFFFLRPCFCFAFALPRRHPKILPPGTDDENGTRKRRRQVHVRLRCGASQRDRPVQEGVHEKVTLSYIHVVSPPPRSQEERVTVLAHNLKQALGSVGAYMSRITTISRDTYTAVAVSAPFRSQENERQTWLIT